MQGSAQPTIAVVLKGYPRLSETFIAQELLGLEKAGLKLRLFSLRHPSDKKTHPVHQQIQAGVTYLPEYLWREPRRVLAAWWHQRRQPRYRALLRCFWKDLKRDMTANRLRRLGQALVLAQELPSDVAWIYAHFLHTPASVARYAAILKGLPWSCSAHAKDIWTTPEWEKREKLAALSWAVTCTKAGQEHLAGLCDKPEKVSLLHHGLDLSRFTPPPPAPARAEPRLLCVARLVEKKGVDVLLQALARLPRELPWRLTQIGGGPLAAPLAATARELGLEERIDWLGAASQNEVLAAYRAADIFVLASRIAGDGDRDGLPNVLMEAQSQGLAVVASDLPGIAELILPEKTGLLVPPNDAEKLSAALLRILSDDALRKRLAEAGQARVRALFDSGPGLSWLAARFGHALGTRDVAA